VWNTTLDAEDGVLSTTQAGEVDDENDEPRGGGDKGRDADTGPGGYAGDTVEQGIETADDEPQRPLDREIRGDPRTHEGESYPDDLKRAEPNQPSLAKMLEDETEDERE
jgi:hypothetical protein